MKAAEKAEERARSNACISVYTHAIVSLTPVAVSFVAFVIIFIFACFSAGRSRGGTN